MSYSQLNQDLKCIEFFNNKKDGFFVDVGAHNGVTFSNTYLLEKEYNWTGICVEPIKDVFDKLIKNRNCICKNTGIYDKTGEVTFSIIEGSNEMLSGITEDINHHKAIVEKEGKSITIPTITFTELLDEAQAPLLIDFLSLDTEGSELKILQSLNHKKYKFLYITVEHNYTPLREEIRKFLVSKDYEYINENAHDDIYKLLIN
jgi:FkbM family methyltransferase